MKGLLLYLTNHQLLRSKFRLGQTVHFSALIFPQMRFVYKIWSFPSQTLDHRNLSWKVIDIPLIMCIFKIIWTFQGYTYKTVQVTFQTRGGKLNIQFKGFVYFVFVLLFSYMVWKNSIFLVLSNAKHVFCLGGWFFLNFKTSHYFSVLFDCNCWWL